MDESLLTTFSRRKLFMLGGGVAASTVLLGACGGGRAGELGAGPAGAPQQGGGFVFASPTDIYSTLDLHSSQDPATFRFITPLCSKLLEFKTGPDLARSYELVPDLAREWEVSADGLTYTFHLRDDVTWHDIPPVNGRPFTSDDVLATFEDVINRPKVDPNQTASHAWMFERVAELQAPDDYTFVIKMNRVYAPFETYMAHPWNVILPREHFENKYDIHTMTIGTGPFMLKAYEKGEQMTRVRNPNYFVQGRPFLEELDSVVVPEQNARISAFLSGRLNSTGVPSEQLEQFRSMPDVRLADGGLTPVTLNLQTQRPPFDDLRVRRAVAMAIDFEGMGQTIYPDRWVLSSVIPPTAGAAALPPDEIKKVRPYDPEQARRLLAEAGYPNGFQTSMMVQKLSNQDVDGAQYMIQDLSEVGIGVELQVADTATAVQRRIDGNFDMAKALRGVNMADEYLSDYRSGSRLNYSRFADPELDRMIERSSEILDTNERNAYFHDLARYMETQISAAIYGLAFSATEAVRTSVQDYYPSQMITGRYWADVWLSG